MDTRQKMLQAGKAAALAGVTEAWRSRKEPGGVGGNMKRIATAAIGAAGVDSALDRDPNKSGTRHTIESAIGGVMGNRLVNGRRESRSRSRSRGAKGRSQSSGPGLGALASAAGLATLGAKAYKNYKNRPRNQDDSSDSDDSRGRGNDRIVGGLRARSQSVKRFVNAGLAKLKLDKPREPGGVGYNKNRGGYSDDDDYYPPRPRGGELATQNQGNGDGEKKKGNGTDTDSYSSTEEEKKQKKMRGKEMITAGLATVATIHAAHQVYSSIEKNRKRREEVHEGKISPEEAKRLKNRGRVRDAASVGIAALGIRGAVVEWKEMQEQRHEFHEMQHRLEEKREHRRLKRLKEGSEGNGSDQSSDSQNRQPQPIRYNGSQGDNPYAASSVPPPPMGQAPRY